MTTFAHDLDALIERHLGTPSLGDDFADIVEALYARTMRPVPGLRVPDWIAVAAANLFFNEHMRLYLPLSVGLAFKESHGAAGNWRRLLIHH
jgi:hypothetical protein